MIRTIDIFNSFLPSCTTVLIPVVTNFGSIDSFEFILRPVTFCTGTRSLLAQNLCPDAYALVDALAGVQRRCGFSFAASAEPGFLDTVLGNVHPDKVRGAITDIRRSVRLGRAAAVIATTVIIADDLTVIGVADDVGLIVTIGGWGLSTVADVALSGALAVLGEAEDEQIPDVGPPPYTGEAFETMAGAYAINPECDPVSDTLGH
ncbi:MAG: hypothetical protein AAGA68_20600 [Pseudomonadota bacterium]